MDLSVLIVSFNTRAKTLACLGSIERETRGLEHEVLVLDNASGDGSAGAVRERFPAVRLDQQSTNLGFARAVNRLALAARGEFLLLLNPDTELQERAIERLIGCARAQPQPGILGGRTVCPNGAPDPGFAWGRATPWSTFCLAVGLATAFRRSAFFNPEGVGLRLGEGVHEVDIVSGCFLLVQRATWERLGGFDPGFFMYGEDADLCLRARALGIRSRVTSEAVLVHHGGASERGLTEKQIKLLAAKRRLMALHWSRVQARLGGWLLGGHAFSRAVGYTLLASFYPRRFGQRAEAWRAIWRDRQSWLRTGSAPRFEDCCDAGRARLDPRNPASPAPDGAKEEPVLR